MSAPRSLLKGATVFLVLLSATASVGLAPAQAQRLTWDDFITSQRTLPVNGVPRGQKKPPRPGQPPLGAPNKPPPPSKPPPGPGPQPPPPLGLIPTCSGLATDPCVVPAGVQVGVRVCRQVQDTLKGNAAGCELSLASKGCRSAGQVTCHLVIWPGISSLHPHTATALAPHSHFTQQLLSAVTHTPPPLSPPPPRLSCFPRHTGQSDPLPDRQVPHHLW
jgi:hypothetical protein